MIPAPASHTSTRHSFSIVIPAWNEADFIETTIQSAQRAIAALNQVKYVGDIIVVDNNSSDSTADVATSAGAAVVFEPINQIARARNTGARASTAEWLVFLDADTLITPNLLAATLDALDNKRVIGGGSTVCADSTLTGITKFTLKYWNWYSVKRCVAAGCYIFCSRDAFDEVGGFDEQRYAAEELVISKKLRRLGKHRGQSFVVFSRFPVITSARKVHWYSGKEKVLQVLLLLLPGSTKSKKYLHLWYDRSDIDKSQKR